MEYEPNLEAPVKASGRRFQEVPERGDFIIGGAPLAYLILSFGRTPPVRLFE